MKKLNKKELGFAHPLLLAILLIAVVGVVGYSGRRVINQKNQVDEQSYVQSQQSTIKLVSNNKEITEDTGSNVVSVKRAGSAAEEPSSTTSENNEPASLPESIEVSTEYDVSTPIGSLSQLISAIKLNDYSSVLYFITPNFMSNAYNAVNAQNINDFSSACQNNNICNTLLTTNIEIDLNHLYEEFCSASTSSSLSSCKKISTKFVFEDGIIKTVYYKTVGYNVHFASIEMRHSPGTSYWLIDQITVDDISI